MSQQQSSQAKKPISPSSKKHSLPMQEDPSPPHSPHASNTAEPPGMPAQSATGVENISTSKQPLNGSLDD